MEEDKIDNYETIIKYLTEEAYAELLLEKFDINSNEDEFIDYLISKKIIKTIDWSGEDNDGEIIAFVDDKIKSIHNETVIIDSEKISKTINNKIKKNKLERGDAPLIIFEKLDQQLKKQNYKLVFIDLGNDSYIFTVVKKSNYKRLLKIEKIKFGNIPGEDEDDYKAFVAVKCGKCGTDLYFLLGNEKKECRVCGNLLYDPSDETVLKKYFIHEY